MCIVALLLRGDNTARRPAFDGDTYAGRNTGELHILGGGSKSQACCQSPPSPPHPIPTYSCCSDCAWHLARILCIRAHRKVLVSLGLHHLHAPQVLTRAPLGAAHSRQRRERHVICMTRRIRCGGAVALCRGTQARGRREKAVMSTADERRRAPSHNTRRRTWRGPEPHGRRRLDTRQCSVAKRRGKIPVPSRPRRNDLLVFNEPRRSGDRHRGVYGASTSNAGAAGAARVRPTPMGERTSTPAGSSAGDPRDATTRQPR